MKPLIEANKRSEFTLRSHDFAFVPATGAGEGVMARFILWKSKATSRSPSH